MIAQEIKNMDTGLIPAFIIIGIFYFVFPIWVTIYAFNKGRTGWASATIISIFFGLSPIIAIAALIAVRKPKKASADAQGNPLPRPKRKPLRWVPITAAIVSFLIVAVIGIFSTTADVYVKNPNASPGTSIGAIALFISVIVFFIAKKLVDDRLNAGEKNQPKQAESQPPIETPKPATTLAIAPLVGPEAYPSDVSETGLAPSGETPIYIPTAVARPETAPARSNKTLYLVLLVVGVVLVALISFVLIRNQAPGRPLALLNAPTPTPACAFQCNIGAESYGFDFTCESGVVNTEMNNSTSFGYDASGQVSSITVAVNQKQTYASTQHTYNIVGTIIIDKAAGTNSYNITATGGALGDAPQTCKSGEVGQSLPAQNVPTLPAEPTATPAVPAAPVTSPTPFVPTISIPYCDKARSDGTISGNTYLCMVSEPGDFVGAGKNWLLTPKDVPISIFFWRNEGGDITAGKWSLQFDAPDKIMFAPGIYENAVRAIEAAYKPLNGLDVSGDGRGCNSDSGRFEVLEITLGADKKPTSLAINFEQHCEGHKPVLFGYFRFNSNVP